MTTKWIYYNTFDGAGYIYCSKQGQAKITLEECLEDCDLWENIMDNDDGLHIQLDCNFQPEGGDRDDKSYTGTH